MAAIDGFFTARLKAQIHQPVSALTAVAAGDEDTEQPSAGSEIALVDAALNARYMQWGAVGVMMAMFVWNETKRQPARDRRFSEESREVRESFLKSLETRDRQYLDAMSEIRRSVETHVDRVIQAKERQTEAFHELADEVRSKA